jgi:hypothetical protein
MIVERRLEQTGYEVVDKLDELGQKISAFDEVCVQMCETGGTEVSSLLISSRQDFPDQLICLYHQEDGASYESSSIWTLYEEVTRQFLQLSMRQHCISQPVQKPSPRNSLGLHPVLQKPPRSPTIPTASAG